MAVAVRVAVSPADIVVIEAVAVMLVTALTVMVTDPVWLPEAAVKVAVPAANTVTLPEAETVATAVSLEVQVGLIVALVPLLSFAVAVTVTVCPTIGIVVEALAERLVTVTAGVEVELGAVGLEPPPPPQAAVPKRTNEINTRRLSKTFLEPKLKGRRRCY